MNKEEIKGFSNLQLEIANFLSSNESVSKEYLKEKGIDSNKIEDKGLKLIKKALLIKKASINEKVDSELLKIAFENLKLLASESLKKPSEILKELLKGNNSPSFQFRNVENLGEEEIKEILGEVNLIKLMEQIDKEQKGKK